MSISVILRTRKSGGSVAPCGVVAIGDGTTSTQTSRPWDEIEYFTTFGKVGAGNYRDVGQQNRSKNESRQMVCGTMYETSGTYTITMYATDGVDFGSDTKNVVIANPDTTFSGTNTVCASTDGDFTGAPSGSNNITTSDFDTFVTTHKGAGKRLLFRNGRTYTDSAGVTITHAGPWQIGTFGTGTRALIEGTGGTTFQVSSGPSNDIADGVIYGLEHDGNSGVNAMFIHLEGGFTGLTVWNCYSHHHQQMLELSYEIIDFYNGTANNGHVPWQGLVVAECDASDLVGGSGGYLVGYMSCQESAFLDVQALNTTLALEMTVRMVYSNLVAFQHCNFSGGPNTKTMFNLRCPQWTEVGFEDNTLPANTYSQYVFVSDSKFTGIALGGVWIAYCGPQSNTLTERIRRCVWDSNWFVFSSANDVGLTCEGFDFCIRNNVADLSGNTSGATAYRYTRSAGFHHASNPASMTGNRAYNNTAYSSATGALGNIGFSIDSNTSAVIKNIILWCKNDTTATTISDSSSSTLGGNSTNTQARQATNPFAATISGTPLPSEFVLAAGSYARDAGVTVPVFADLGGWHKRPQNTTYDIGALEYDNGELFPWESIVSVTHRLRPAMMM